MGSLIRATNLWGFSELVRDLGGDPEALLARCHLPGDVDRREDGFVPFHSTSTLLEVAAGELGCPDFGLRLSRWQGLDILGPIAVIARNAQTVHDGLAAVARYLHVHSPALVLAAAPPLRDHTRRFTYEVVEGTLPRLRQSYELSLANGVRIIRLLGGDDAAISSVSFLHAQLGADSAYADALRCPTRFAQSWCGFEIATELASRPIDSADDETRKLATRFLESESLAPSARLTDRVSELARRLLPTGHCTTDVIADQLGLHPRTLQRRLGEEGTRCVDLIEQQRRELAATYLAEPGLHLSQVAGLLGYSEQSSLNRSCRRWFAQTPRQLRAAARGA